MWSKQLRSPALRRLSRAISTRPQTSHGPRKTLQRIRFPQHTSGQRNQSSSKNPEPENHPTSTSESLSSTLRNTEPERNSLLSPIHIPEDPNAVLKDQHPAAKLLTNSGLVVQRQLELMNVMLGFEQANRYVIMDARGNHVGYMAEQETGLGGMLARQWFRTHRGFVTHVFDRDENEVLRFHRPFSWINSRIRVYDPLGLADAAYSPTTAIQGSSPPSLTEVASGSNTRVSPLKLDEMRVVGEAQQQWAPLRRKYDLFLFHPSPTPETDMGSKPISSATSNLSQVQQTQLMRTSGNPSGVGEYHQFAFVDEPFLSWDFSLQAADGRLIGSVNRDFAGFAREIFTDTGVYALRMDAAALGAQQATPQSGASPAAVVYPENAHGMTLDQRAVMLATAVSIDFDYFSRHSHAGGMGFMPMWFPEATTSSATAGEAGVAGAEAAGTSQAAAAETSAGAIGRAGAAEGVAAGAASAGTIAGYESMRRGMHDDTPSASSAQQQQQQPPFDPQTGTSEDGWKEDFWGRDGGASSGDSGEGPGADSDDDFDWF
ncbi:hypothetical protein Egran_03166 [Elaphomyces granulatus]|uniref:Phospholipid scramblase n=1 Tax=Elaphomyces granulatus TaxID=519963 RepID=A0A232LY24_9EURO|nr:hypothetical protein Egran_03166 [Elaphomyces granulatus]